MSAAGQNKGIELSISVQGLREAIQTLEKVPGKTARKFVKKAMRTSLTSLLRGVKESTPVGPTGNLKASMKKRAAISLNGRRWLWGEVYADRSGSSKDPNNKGNNLGFHAHWIEMGWKLTKGKKATANRRVIKSIPGQRFMQKVLQAQAQTIVDNFAKNVIETAKEVEESINGGGPVSND